MEQVAVQMALAALAHLVALHKKLPRPQAMEGVQLIHVGRQVQVYAAKRIGLA